jgi:hypothetical protein
MYAGGFYVNELVRRVDPQKRTIRQLVENINKELDTELYIGLTDAQEERFAPLIEYPVFQLFLRVLPRIILRNIPFVDPLGDAEALKGASNPESMIAKGLNSVMTTSLSALKFVNTRDYRKGEMVHANGFGNAVSLAKLAAVMALGGSGVVDGKHVDLISKQAWDKAMEFTETQFDYTLLANITRSKAGFAKMSDLAPELKSSIGWVGLGGSMMVWDPKLKMSFAYIPRAKGHAIAVDKRPKMLYDALMKLRGV